MRKLSSNGMPVPLLFHRLTNRTSVLLLETTLTVLLMVIAESNIVVVDCAPIVIDHHVGQLLNDWVNVKQLINNYSDFIPRDNVNGVMRVQFQLKLGPFTDSFRAHLEKQRQSESGIIYELQLALRRPVDVEYQVSKTNDLLSPEQLLRAQDAHVPVRLLTMRFSTALQVLCLPVQVLVFETNKSTGQRRYVLGANLRTGHMVTVKPMDEQKPWAEGGVHIAVIELAPGNELGWECKRME